MLSGVGPREHLEQLDIPLIKHIPGVGQNLHDHVSFPGIVHKIHKTHCNNTFDETLAAYSFLINRQGPLTSIGTSNILGYIYTKSGERSDYPNVEMRHHYLHKNYMNSFLTRYGFIMEIGRILQQENENSPLLVQIPTLLNPRSRGEIKLQSSNPRVPALIDPKYLTEPEDITAMLIAIRHALDVGGTPAMTVAGAELLELNVTTECGDGCPWRCLLKQFAMTGNAPVGTTKMGKCENCAGAVVDPTLKVHGIKGLRVADASIMPEVVSGDINAATIMIAQKAGDMIWKDWEAVPEKECCTAVVKPT